MKPHASIFRRVKEILETKGWCQGMSTDHQGRHCLEGAIAVACGIYDEKSNSFLADERMFTYVHRQLGVPGCVWNDCPNRKYEDVVKLLDELIGEH